MQPGPGPGGLGSERAAIGSLKDSLKTFLYVAAHSFGGPAGQIAVMHRVYVKEKRWLSEERFLHALNYCMLLPGPEAQQLAIYIGWLRHGTLGGLLSGGLFVLPGFLSILALSILYVTYHQASATIFYGIKAAVVAVVLEAVLRIGRRALVNRMMWFLAGASFVAIFFGHVPFPLIIVAAAMVGLVTKPGKVKTDEEPLPTPPKRNTLKVALFWLTLWFLPTALLYAALGPQSIFVQEGLFFTQAAMVTFGGAYSVLAYIAQKAVETYGWLKPGEMMDGLGMAETTPGPLIQVVQFVAFLGAYRHAGELPPLLAGLLGSLLTTWVTYTPCFLWVFTGAPYIEDLRRKKSLNHALTAITAAVVGVILNLSVWFAMHTLTDWKTILIAGGAALALLRYHVGMMKVLAASALIGLLVARL